MSKLFFPVLILLLAGCSGLRRSAIDAAAAGGGAYMGYELSGGTPLGTIAGAAGGVIAAEGVQGLMSNQTAKAFKSGYQKGQSDAVKGWYHQLQDQQRHPSQP